MTVYETLDRRPVHVTIADEHGGSVIVHATDERYTRTAETLRVRPVNPHAYAVDAWRAAGWTELLRGPLTQAGDDDDDWTDRAIGRAVAVLFAR